MRGEFTARYQDATDLADLARREHLNATTTTNYFFAHWSGWFGTRTEIRKWLLARVMPGVGGLTSVLGFRPAPALSESEVRLKSEARLRELKTLCDEYGARLTIVIPPTLSKEDHAEVVSALGRELGVPMRICNLAYAEMTEACNRGWEGRDSRSVMLLQQERAGVKIAADPERVKQAAERAKSG